MNKKIYGYKAYCEQNHFSSQLITLWYEAKNYSWTQMKIIDEKNKQVFNTERFKRLSDKAKNAVYQVDCSLHDLANREYMIHAYLMPDGTIVPSGNTVESPYFKMICEGKEYGVKSGFLWKNTDKWYFIMDL